MASNIKASKKSSTSQRKASNSKSSKRPSNSRRKASNDISKSNGKTKASNNSTTSDMRTLDEEDSDDLNGLYGATPPPPRRSTRHTQAETIIKSETGMLEETDSDDPNGLYGASPLLAQQSSRIVPSTFTTGGLNNTVSTVTSSQEMTVGDGNQHHARLKTPEFVPWIPAERYVSPELDGPWKPYQPAQPADQSPHGPVPAPRGVQAGNANVSDESNSSLGESDSDSEFGYISPSQPSKKRKDESDDDYKDPGTKKSSATYQVKQSSSRKTGSKAKNSATSNNSQTSITKSRKRARDYDELEEEEEEPKPKPKKPKTASTSISQYDPKWNIPNGDLGSWHKDTYVALLQILRNIRAQETAAGKTGVQGLRDVKLWNYASAELAKVGHFRSGSACKLFWGRYGRRESQFDERANPGMCLPFLFVGEITDLRFPDPTRLCTSMQK